MSQGDRQNHLGSHPTPTATLRAVLRHQLQWRTAAGGGAGSVNDVLPVLTGAGVHAAGRYSLGYLLGEVCANIWHVFCLCVCVCVWGGGMCMYASIHTYHTYISIYLHIYTYHMHPIPTRHTPAGPAAKA